MNTRASDILTPEQAAAHLQVSRETIYRYIRSGKLDASRSGRDYRITVRSINQLLADNRARPDIQLREYSDRQLADFLDADQPTSEVQ
jgi:excisionase family DNA binding protein